MELEWHQPDLRYEALRRHHPAHERQLLASVAELGQQTVMTQRNLLTLCR